MKAANVFHRSTGRNHKRLTKCEWTEERRHISPPQYLSDFSNAIFSSIQDNFRSGTRELIMVDLKTEDWHYTEVFDFCMVTTVVPLSTCWKGVTEPWSTVYQKPPVSAGLLSARSELSWNTSLLHPVWILFLLLIFCFLKILVTKLWTWGWL